MLYREALAKSLASAMEADPRVVCMGVGVADPKGIFGTTLEARNRFPERVLETPLSENMLTGACTGLALEGWKPVLVHARLDFLLLTMEHLVNTAAKWPFMSKGKPLTFVVRAVVGRGWGQGPQHSQALHALFTHIPGLNVVMPASTAGALDALPWALSQPQPTIVIEHRRLFETNLALPAPYPDGNGCDATVVYVSASVLDVMEARRLLEAEGVRIAVFGLERIAPLDLQDVFASVEQTRRLVVVDIGHATCGLSAEVAARAAERFPGVSVRRVTPPFMPCPTSSPLEREFYPDAGEIVDAVRTVMGVSGERPSVVAADQDKRFRGPF